GPGSWLRPRPGAVCPWAGVAANGTAASSASREDIAPALTRVMHPPTRAPLYGASRVAGAPFRSGARRLFTSHFLRSLAPRVTERHVTLRNTSRPHLTELQQAILDIVWSKKAATADAVREALQPLALASDLPGPPDLPDPPDLPGPPDLRVRGAELPHAAQPAVVVGRLAAEVFSDVGMREDEESLLVEPLDDGVRRLLRLDRRIEQERAATRGRAIQHVGAHALRAQRRHLDP